MIETEQIFDFDVAFSFLHNDESIAFQINDLIQDRFKTFIYSQHQKDLVGRDGESAFNEVFSTKARIVIVLFREEWAKTTWTRIEETAIRNRAHEEGYDFVTFVQMDSSAKIPKWLPKNRIYYDFERWGVNGLAPIIETRIQEAGGAANAESLQDHAARLKRSVLLEKERTKHFIYNDTHLISRNEFNSLSEFANSKAKSLEDREIDLVFGFESLPNSYLIIRFSNFSLNFNLTLKFNSTKRESFLNVTIASYDLEEKARYRESKDIPIESQEYIFDYNPVINEPGWSQEIIDNSFILANSLVDKWLKRFLDFVGKTSRNNERYK